MQNCTVVEDIWTIDCLAFVLPELWAGREGRRASGRSIMRTGAQERAHIPGMVYWTGSEADECITEDG